MVSRPSLIGIIAIALIALAALGNLLFHTLGYTTAYSAYEATELAKRFVMEGRVPKDCFKIKTFFPTYPSLGSLRVLCIYEYAKEKKDIVACNLILPNEYALACLSEVGGQIFSGSHCTGTYGRDEVYCSRFSAGGELTISNPQIKNCQLYKRKDVREWCYYERTFKFKNIHECNYIENEITIDDCENAFAFKQKDSALCSAVKDPKRREYCEIRINTWLKYPELRSSFYFGISVPVD